MEIQAILTAISSIGFPIVACIGMAWYVKYQTDRNSEELKAIRKEHNDEIAKVTEALNNNTLAIQKLSDRLEN